MKTALLSSLLTAVLLSVPISLMAQTKQSSSASGGSVAQRLQACKSKAGMNLIEREQCVWSMCKGRWGKSGCPAENKGQPLGSR
jgi:hypothetical protein